MHDSGNSSSAATLREAAPRERIIPRMTQPHSVMSSRGQKPARRISGQTIFLAVVVVISFCVFGYLVFLGDGGRDGNGQASVSRLRREEIPFNGARAYEDLKQPCAIGPRGGGS